MAEINYPNGKKATSKNNTIIASSKSLSTSRRGMLFEHELNESNKYYLNKDIAVIYKKPTPIQIVKVEYPQRSKAKIVEAYYQAASTTDYNGIYREKYIDYEAKQTDSLTFPFKNISIHQINHLVKIDKQGGIAFVILYFKTIDKVYLIDIKDFYKVYLEGMNGKAKSIHQKNILDIGGREAKKGYNPMIDYLKTVDEMYFDK